MGDWFPKEGHLRKAIYLYGQRIAIREVTKAVRRGDLAPAKDFDCKDCGKPATEYDHRDYNKPLKVSPVCHRCNMLRGEAIPMRPLPDGLKEKVFKLRDKLKAEATEKRKRHMEKYYGSSR